MKVTKQGLLDRPEKFGNSLIFLLYGTSPHFGKLGGRFRPNLGGNWPFYRLESEPVASIKSAIEEIPNNANEEQVCRSLMTAIFGVAPDYNRTVLEYPPLTDEQGFRWPSYPRYKVLPDPTNYRPLKTEEIQPEDIQKFQQKLQVLKAPFNERLLEEYHTSQKKVFLTQQKLTTGTQLILPKNDNHN